MCLQRHLEGGMPVACMNWRLKLDTESKPTASEMLSIESVVDRSRSQARFMRSRCMYSSGEQPITAPNSLRKCVALR